MVAPINVTRAIFDTEVRTHLAGLLLKRWTSSTTESFYALLAYSHALFQWRFECLYTRRHRRYAFYFCIGRNLLPPASVVLPVPGGPHKSWSGYGPPPTLCEGASSDLIYAADHVLSNSFRSPYEQQVDENLRPPQNLSCIINCTLIRRQDQCLSTDYQTICQFDQLFGRRPRHLPALRAQRSARSHSKSTLLKITPPFWPSCSITLKPWTMPFSVMLIWKSILIRTTAVGAKRKLATRLRDVVVVPNRFLLLSQQYKGVCEVACSPVNAHLLNERPPVPQALTIRYQ